MEKKELELIVRVAIVDFQVTCNNASGMVAFVLTEDCRLLRIDVSNGYWRPGYGWADKAVWVERKVTIREIR